MARQSIRVGLGLSAVAMLSAAFGRIPPTAGALLQEAIDVAVILNALRASGGCRDGRAQAPAADDPAPIAQDRVDVATSAAA